MVKYVFETIYVACIYGLFFQDFVVKYEELLHCNKKAVSLWVFLETSVDLGSVNITTLCPIRSGSHLPDPPGLQQSVV